jgi:hypothetical protein
VVRVHVAVLGRHHAPLYDRQQVSLHALAAGVGACAGSFVQSGLFSCAGS